MKLKKLATLLCSLFLMSCTSTTNNTTTQSPADPSSPSATDSNYLIAYFSGTGSTEKVAGYIQEATKGTLFEIEPVDEYTSADLNYSNSSSRVVREHNDESLQDIELKVTTPANFDSYNVVFIGFPIWWQGPAWPVFNFVKDNDFTNKTIIPFATSASSGLGNSKQTLQNMANGGTWLDGRRFSSSANKDQVVSWVEGLNI